MQSQLLQYYKSFQGNVVPGGGGRAGMPNMMASPPTFEDLSIDDSLSELQRLVRYAKSSIGLQRSALVNLVRVVYRRVLSSVQLTFYTPSPHQ